MSRTEPARGKPTTTVTTYDANGNPVKSVTTDPNTTAPTKPIEKDRAYYSAMAQFSNTLLKMYPDLAELIRTAVSQEWTDDEFWQEYNKTPFAQQREKAEEEFDIGIQGDNADTYQKKVTDTATALTQNAQRLGLTLSPEEIQAQARAIVRSNLSQEAQSAWFGQTWQQGAQAGKPTQGTASLIQQSLKSLASDYGLSISEEMLRSKTGQGLGQGDRWQEWLQGQEAVFKEQAKLMYPKAGGLLDQYRLSQVAEPYLQEAASMLGLSQEQMSLTDPKWSAFLNGPQGVMSRDEWVRVLKTDPQYGWDKSTRARQEFAPLADDLLAAFGKA